MKIAVAGVGYVVLSNAELLAQHNDVKTFKLRKEKAEMINAGKSPVVDTEISEYLVGETSICARRRTRRRCTATRSP